MRQSNFSLPLRYRATPLVCALCLALANLEAVAETPSASTGTTEINLNVPISGLEGDGDWGGAIRDIKQNIDTAGGIVYTFEGQTVKSSASKGIILAHVSIPAEQQEAAQAKYFWKFTFDNLDLDVTNNVADEITGADLRFFDPGNLTTPKGAPHDQPSITPNVYFKGSSISVEGSKAGQTVTGLFLGDRSVAKDTDDDVNASTFKIHAKATNGKAVGIHIENGAISTSGALTVTAEGQTEATGVLIDAEKSSKDNQFIGKTDISATIPAETTSRAAETTPKVRGVLVKNAANDNPTNLSFYNGTIRANYEGSNTSADVVGVEIDVRKAGDIAFGRKMGVNEQVEDRPLVPYYDGTVDITANDNPAGSSVGLRIAVENDDSDVYYHSGTITADTALELKKRARLSLSGKVIFDGEVKTDKDTRLTLDRDDDSRIRYKGDHEAVFKHNAQIDGWLDVKKGTVTVGADDSKATVSVKKVKSSETANWKIEAGSILKVLKADETQATNVELNAEAETPSVTINNLTNAGTVSAAGGKAVLTGSLAEDGTAASWTASEGGELHFRNTHDEGSSVSLGRVAVADSGSAVRFDSEDGTDRTYDVRDLSVAGTLNVDNRAKVTVTDAFAAGENTVIRVGTEGGAQKAASLTVNRTPEALSLHELHVAEGSEAHFLNASEGSLDKNRLHVGTIANAGTVGFEGAALTAKVSQKGDWSLKNSRVDLTGTANTLEMGNLSVSGLNFLHFDTSEGKKVTIDRVAYTAPLTRSAANEDGWVNIEIDEVKPDALQIGAKENVKINVTLPEPIAPSASAAGSFTPESVARGMAETVRLGDPADNKTAADRVEYTDPLRTVTGTITDGNIDGMVVTTSINENVKAYKGLQTLSTMLWRHEMNDLTKRMGELRDAPEGVGSWVRLTGSEQTVESATKVESNSVQAGVDVEALDGLRVGTAVSYTKSDSSFAAGSGDSESWSAGLYGSWLFDNGAFIDLIAKYHRMENELSFGAMTGSFDNDAVSVSAETGWRWAPVSWAFIEPQVEVTYGEIKGDTFKTGNNITVMQEKFKSLIARGGVRAGVSLPNKLGNCYLRVSALHDFEGDMRATASVPGTTPEYLTADYGDSWVEYALGANVNLADWAYTYFDVERTEGGKIEENWRWNLGLRLGF